jgi:hypothetical protein
LAHKVDDGPAYIRANPALETVSCGIEEECGLPVIVLMKLLSKACANASVHLYSELGGHLDDGADLLDSFHILVFHMAGSHVDQNCVDYSHRKI